jgi:ribose transport system substrate-binding protein
MSFAVANSFDAPMLAAAQAVAADNNAKLTVFDANNDPQLQHSQLQDVITSKKYDGIITQPIFGTGLVDLVKQAVDQGIKVVNINQILGPDLTTAEPQVPGMSASVALVPTDLGKNIGEQAVAACAARSLDPCTVGYLYDIKASALDVAMRDGFNEATKGSPIKIVAEGESFFTATVALGAVQDMLTAHPDIQLIVGSDQGIQGAIQAIDAAGKTGTVSLVGYGGSATGVAGVAAGTWFSTVLMTPASEGRLGMQALIKAIRTGEDSGAVNPTEGLPEVITKDNASEFTAEWLG